MSWERNFLQTEKILFLKKWVYICVGKLFQIGSFPFTNFLEKNWLCFKGFSRIGTVVIR